MIIPVFSAVSIVFAMQSATSLHPELASQKIVKEAKQCAQIANDQQRLICFDVVFKPELTEPQKRPMPFEKNPIPPESPPLPPKASHSPTEPSASSPSVSQVVESTTVEANHEAVEAKVIHKETPKEAVQKFGAEHLKTESEKDIELEVVTFTIEKVGLTLRKQQRFYFTNGQIWENKTSKQLRVEAGDEVQIKDGALSAFYLSKVDGSRSVRVKRVK